MIQLFELFRMLLLGGKSVNPELKQSKAILTELRLLLADFQREPTAKRKQKLTEILEDLPLGLLAEQATELGEPGEAAFNDLMLARETFLSTDKDEAAKQAVNKLRDLVEQLQQMQRESAKKNTRNSWIKRASVVLPLVAAYFLSGYLQDENTFLLQEEHVIWPTNAYNPADDREVIELNENYRTSYLDRFPDWYFRKEESLGNWFMRKQPNGELTSSLEFKWIFKNQSSSFVQMLSTLQVTAEQIESKPFPWEELVIESGFELTEVDPGLLWLHNTGSTPILDLRIGLTSAQKSLHKDTIIEYLKADKYLDLSEQYMAGWVPIQLDPVSGRMQTNVFISIRDSQELKVEDYGFLWEGRWYKMTDDPDQLAKKTILESVDFKVRYFWKDLYGNPDSGKLHVKQPNLLYYRINSDVLENDPTSYYGGPPDAVKQVSPMYHAAEQLYQKIAGEGPESHPEGLDSWSGSLEMNWREAPEGLPVDVLINPDVPLNPSGFAIVYFQMQNPQNGRYRLQVKANNKVIRTVELDVLAPEEFEFHYPASMDYFRKTSEDLTDR